MPVEGNFEVEMFAPVMYHKWLEAHSSINQGRSN